MGGVAPLTKRSKAELGEHQKGLKFATNFATQVLVAFIGAFLLGYFFIETFVAPENFNAKVIAGAGCSFCTLLLESVLFVVHESKDQMIQEHRAKLDRKRPVDLAPKPAGNMATTCTSPAGTASPR